MPEVKGSVEILRPVEEVFAFMKDPKNNLKWETGVVEMELTSEGPLAVGSKGRRVEQQMGRDEGEWEITTYVENEALGMVFESGRYTGSGGYNFAATDAGTTLEFWFNGNPKSVVFKILMPLMMPMFRRQIRKDFVKLKGILES